MKKISVFAAALVVMMIGFVSAADISVATCEEEDVQAAIESAEEGDTVIMPEGGCTWTTWIAGKASVTIAGKSIKLKGSGVDETIITADTDGGDWPVQSPLKITFSEGMSVDISDFSVDMADYKDSYGFMYLSGGGKNFRIHDMKFFSSGTEPGRTFRITAGKFDAFSIDNNEFLLKTQAMWIDQAAYDGDGDCSTSSGHDSFCSSYNYGTIDGMFLEDNEFNYVGDPDTVSKTAADVLGGARFIFRKNNLTNTGVYTHGYETNQQLRGPRVLEIYNNTFSRTYRSPHASLGSAGIMTFRGGTGIVTNNILNDNGDPNVYDIVARFQIKRRIGLPEVCSGCQSMCDGNQECDGNGDPTGYPCRDQPGFGLDSGFTTSQTLEPIYIWNNDDGGRPSAFVDGVTDYIIEGREYILSERPEYKSYNYPHPLTEAPFLTTICGEGEIIEDCWCEGAMRTNESCNNGYYTGTVSVLELEPENDTNDTIIDDPSPPEDPENGTDDDPSPPEDNDNNATLDDNSTDTDNDNNYNDEVENGTTEVEGDEEEGEYFIWITVVVILVIVIIVLSLSLFFRREPQEVNQI